MTLLAKEFRHAVCSLLYLVFVGAVLIFYTTQFGGDLQSNLRQAAENSAAGVFTQPQPGQSSYGSTYSTNPEIIMPQVLGTLIAEYDSGEYKTYPLGFAKTVRPSDAGQNEIRQAMETVTGLAYADLYALYTQANSGDPLVLEGAAYTLYLADYQSVFPFVVSYDAFKAEMAAVDRVLGGASAYDPADFSTAALQPKTYEQALADYQDFMLGDRVTRAYARLFCDYMGIATGLFAVFIPVGFLLRDARANMAQLIYSRRCGSFRLIVARYGACLGAIMLPLVVLGLFSTFLLLVFCAGQGIQADPFAFLAYTGAWLLPTAMVCCSVGFFFTILTGTPLGVALQFLWVFFLDIPGSTRHMGGGGYGLSLVLRHNQLGGRALMLADMPALVANRLGYTALALALLALSVYLYALQRRGRLNGYAWLRRRIQHAKNPIPAGSSV